MTNKGEAPLRIGANVEVLHIDATMTEEIVIALGGLGQKIERIDVSGMCADEAHDRFMTAAHDLADELHEMTWKAIITGRRDGRYITGALGRMATPTISLRNDLAEVRASLARVEKERDEALIRLDELRRFLANTALPTAEGEAE